MGLGETPGNSWTQEVCSLRQVDTVETRQAASLQTMIMMDYWTVIVTGNVCDAPVPAAPVMVMVYCPGKVPPPTGVLVLDDPHPGCKRIVPAIRHSTAAKSK